MYHQYFGLNEAPFSIAVNPRYLFMSARHRDALAHLLYGVGAGGGFILLTGEVGTGKTTINRCLLEQLPQDTDIAMVLNPALNAMELLATVCDELGIDYERNNHTLKTLTDSLHRYLLDNYQRGRKTVLLIDEAQHLDFDVLEQIRLLTNLETNSEKLLQIILIGQPELAEKLARPELRQLNQRITARYNLEPLNLEETGAYIQHRLQVAGMSMGREIFPPDVVRGVYQATRGIPRVINVLCDRILLGAYGRNKLAADRAMLQTAVEEVLGSQADAHAQWGFPLAIIGGLALVLLLVSVGGWLLLSSGAPGPAAVETVPTSTATNTIASTGTTAPATEVVAESAHTGQPVAAPTAGIPAPSTALDAAALADGGPARMPAAQGGAAAASTYLLGPGEAADRLWSIYTDTPPNQPCPAGVFAGLRCETRSAATWDELALLNRPVALSLVTPQRFSAAAVLLGIEGARAWVWGRQGLQQIGLAQLAPLWDGNFSFLWQVPDGFEAPLALGQQGLAVASVALLFMQLDGQSQPLTRGVFNAPLQQRVKLFQRAQGLVDDGVVGAQTLLALNAALGIDPDPALVRERVMASTNQGVLQ
jgi:general secretion pathway protein A